MRSLLRTDTALLLDFLPGPAGGRRTGSTGCGRIGRRLPWRRPTAFYRCLLAPLAPWRRASCRTPGGTTPSPEPRSAARRSLHDGGGRTTCCCRHAVGSSCRHRVQFHGLGGAAERARRAPGAGDVEEGPIPATAGGTVRAGTATSSLIASAVHVYFSAGTWAALPGPVAHGR